jgi:preprotein translocase subunit SecA
MDDLKGNVGLQAYAQRDPINEYRIQGADLFDTMVDDIRQNTVRGILSVMPRPQPIQRVQVANPLVAGFEGMKKKPIVRKASKTVVNDSAKVGRNDPCPCGSGKKYKNCCMRNDAGSNAQA